jgi:uncharacterized protein (TIGR02246 family)
MARPMSADPESTGVPASVARFVAAINAHDAEAVADLAASDHRFIDSLGAVVEGREAIRSAWRAYFGMVPDYALAVTPSFVSGSEVMLLGTAGGSFAPAGSRNETRWQTPVAVRVRVRDGAVAEWQVFADNEPLRRLLRGG